MSAYRPEEWQSIDALGQVVDQDLHRLGVGLTMGGEPTYVSATDLESLQWRYQALGDDKRRMGEHLLRRLQADLAPKGALLHYGVGKFYPGEPFPRWALGCFWREDGQSLWQYPHLIAESPDPALTWQAITPFMETLLADLGLPEELAMVAHTPETGQPVGYVLPLLPVESPEGTVWASCVWKLGSGTQPLTLVPGNTPTGMRLPLGQLQRLDELATEASGSLGDSPIQARRTGLIYPNNTIQVALCIDVRDGRMHVFMPPLFAVRGYVDLLAAIERAAILLQQPVLIEGYRPPLNQGIQGFQITPDPGVLEVNIHPARSWSELVDLHSSLDQAAMDCGLATTRFERDGRPIDTGGGAHITLGARHPQDSPLLRRPDLLQSFVTYWQHHPSLTYLFAGQFVGPTSQSPRVDEASLDSLDQLEMAFALLEPEAPLPPDVVDHLLHHLLVDVTGNTHRAAFCIDKLFPGNNPQLQLGLLELRGFAMPPDGQMRLLQMLLVRACLAWFWQTPYRYPFRRWGRTLHDRFLLPYYIEADLALVLSELHRSGYGFNPDWFKPFLEFRCPIYGQIEQPGLSLELRHALEPWPVLANETTGSGTSRPVDDSTERLQVMLRATPRDDSSDAASFTLVCNGQRVPLQPTAHPGQFVAGVRYRARSYTWTQVATALQAVPPGQRHRLATYLQPVQTLRFELFDSQTHRPLGGCLYRVQTDNPDGEAPGWPTSVAQAEQRLHHRLLPLTPEDSMENHPQPLPQDHAWVTFDLRDPRRT